MDDVMKEEEFVNKIICHDVTKSLPLPDGCIDVIFTSPPYWGLRDYGVKGQIGLEDHPNEYIEKITRICRDLKRVLKETGSFYLNIGDTYYGSGGAGGDYNKGGLKEGQPKYKQGKKHRSKWLQPKQLMGMPWRVAISLQEDGWVLRNCIIWHKPNPMPSSAKDRLANTYEFLFFFVKKSRGYYYDLDAIREPHKELSLLREKYGFDNIPRAWESGAIPIPGGKDVNIRNYPAGKNPGDVIDWKEQDSNTDNEPRISTLWKTVGIPRTTHDHGKNPGDILEYDSKYKDGVHGQTLQGFARTKTMEQARQQSRVDAKVLFPNNKKAQQEYINIVQDHDGTLSGKNPGDYMDVCTQAFTAYNQELEHFAVFPEEIVEKPLMSSCPREICKKCGKARRRITNNSPPTDTEGWGKPTKQHTKTPISTIRNKKGRMGRYDKKTINWSDCGCNAGFSSGIVLDPFCGRGTVGKVARDLGLNYVLFDIKPEYCELARLFIAGQKYKIHKDQTKLKGDKA